MKFQNFKQEVATFNECGYIILKDVVCHEKLLAFKATLTRLTDAVLERASKKLDSEWMRFASIDEKLIELKNNNPDHISLIQRIVSRTPEFFSLSSSMEALPFMRLLYGLDEPSPVYVINNGVVFTCPHDQANTAVSNFETDWHNDVFYTIPNTRFWQIWAPLLHDATIDIGALIVCPGSHKDGVGKQVMNIDVNYNQRYLMQTDVISNYTPKSVPVRLGDMMIFDSRLIHKSGKNSSTKIRCTMLGAYHDVMTPEFSPIGFEYKYYGKTPEAYFYEMFGDEEAKKIMFNDSANPELALKNGV